VHNKNYRKVKIRESDNWRAIFKEIRLLLAKKRTGENSIRE
jgi:hypothetical protein